MSQERSKYLSYLLRHKPEVAKLTLDKEGWCKLEQLLKNTDFTLEELEAIVAEDEKKRYAFKYWELVTTPLQQPIKEPIAIRANQGHSTNSVKMNFKAAVPPTVLYHGTTTTAVEQIKKQGLKPMSRHYVHASADVETAASVGGRRRGVVTIFMIDTAKMLRDGYMFRLSDNKVWLIEAVPPKYLTEMA